LTTIFDKYYDVTFDERDGSVHLAIREVLEWSMSGRPRDEQILSQKNDDLCDVVFDRLDTTLIIAILRTTFIIREVLGCWFDKVDEADAILTKRGLISKHILRGLKRFPE
jgi:hypothetical protein